MGMKPSKKKKKLPASFRADGLDCILLKYTIRPSLVY